MILNSISMEFSQSCLHYTRVTVRVHGPLLFKMNNWIFQFVNVLNFIYHKTPTVLCTFTTCYFFRGGGGHKYFLYVFVLFLCKSNFIIFLYIKYSLHIKVTVYYKLNEVRTIRNQIMFHFDQCDVASIKVIFILLYLSYKSMHIWLCACKALIF